MRRLFSSLKRSSLAVLLALVAAAGLAAGAPAAWAALVNGYVFTGQTGSQTFIDETHTTQVYIKATSDTQIMGGNLRMSADGSATDADTVTFTLYAPNKTTVLGRKTLTKSQFCALHTESACGNFGQVLFSFSSPVPLTNGLTYYATVTSPANFRQKYLIKGADACSVTNATGTSTGTASCSSTAPAAPLLSVSKSAPASVTAGDTLDYAISVTNSAQATAFAPGATVKDQLPDGVSFAGFSGTGWSCSEASGLVTCRYGSRINVGASSSTLTISTVADGSVASLTNYATVDQSGGTSAPTPGPGFCTAGAISSGACDTAATTVVPAVFTILKSDPSPSLQVGAESTYTLTVTTGSASIAAEVKDQLPAGFEFVSATGTGWSCDVDAANLVTCSKTMSSAATETIAVVVMPGASVSGESVTNYASAGPSGNAPDPGPGCNTPDCASKTSTVEAAPFSIEKSAPSPALKVGVESTYTLTVAVAGTGISTDVKDLLPAGLALTGVTGDGWDCSNAGSLVSCNKSMSSSAEGLIYVKVIPDETVAGDSVTNNASVGPEGNAPTPDGGDCTGATCDSNTSDVIPAGASFSVSKSAPSPGLKVGQESVYTLTVTTDGTGVAAEVKDQLPEGLSFVSAEGAGWRCDHDADGLVTCNKDSISSTTPETVEVTVLTDASAAGKTLTNFASAGPEGEAPEPGPACSVSCDSNDSGVADTSFTLIKSAPVPGLMVNRNSTYTLTVTADGTDVATEVKDQLPAGLTFVSASGEGWSCAVDAGNLVTCSKTISSGATEEIKVTVNTKAAVNNQTVTNYASAGPEGDAPQPGPACKGDGCADSAARVADIREEIAKAVEDDVQSYLGARLDQIVGSFDSQSRLSRFRDTACGVSHDLSLNGEGTSHQQNIAANGSVSMKGGIVPTADVPEQCNSRSNVWAQLDVGYVDGLEDSSATGGLITVGAEYLITENFLAGVRLSMDYTDASFDSAANSDISGYGWLAGPYLSAEIASNLFLDGFIGYGTSWNDYSGNYEKLDLSGDFTTQRIAGYLNLSGTYQTGPVELTPLLGVSFGKEWSDSFDVHNAVVGDTRIASQEAGLGRLKGRIEAGYMVTDEVDEQLELFVAPQVTYDFLRNAGPEGELLLGDSLWRGGVEGGFRFAHDNFGASLLVGYDGVGVEDWNAYRGQLQLNYTW